MKFEEIPFEIFFSDSRTVVVERNYYKILKELESKEDKIKFINALAGEQGRSLFKYPTIKEVERDHPFLSSY